MTPYYEDTKAHITIYNCDYREVLSEVMWADLLMTDPPYGIDACNQTLGDGKKDFHRGDWDKERGDILPLWPFIKRQGRRYGCVWGGNYWGEQLPVSNGWLIWKKQEPGVSFSQCELAWSNYGSAQNALGTTKFIEHYWNEEKRHPTQKPLAIMKWAIKQAPADCGKMIADPFMGVGTTLRAARDMGRPAIGCERVKEYCDIAIERLAQETMFSVPRTPNMFRDALQADENAANKK